MSRRPLTRGAQSPRDSSHPSSGSLLAGDDGDTRDIDHDSDASSGDDPNIVKTKSHGTLLALQSAIDGLSQSQLLSVKDMVQKTAQPTRAQKSQRLRAIVDEHMQHLLTEDASAMYDELWGEVMPARSTSSAFLVQIDRVTEAQSGLRLRTLCNQCRADTDRFSIGSIVSGRPHELRLS